MSRKVQVVPGKIAYTQLKLLIVVATLMLVFGVIFAIVVISETSETELIILQVAFFSIFCAVCVGLIVHAARILAKKGEAEENSVVEFHVGDKPSGRGDVAERLRKLEQLKHEGLVSETEYLDKRAQIMKEV